MVHDQTNKDCYAYAVATAIRSALVRVEVVNIPQHHKIVAYLTSIYGMKGADVNDVLKKESQV